MKTKKINFHKATTIQGKRSSERVTFKYKKEKTTRKEETLKK